MRVILQRVAHASVSISDKIYAETGSGLLVLLGIEHNDTQDDAMYLLQKITQLRIFADEDGKMNRSCIDIQGEFLVVSQFTLHASTKKGNRPSFITAAKPEVAIPLYDFFLAELSKIAPQKVKSGQFGANMQVMLTNDGPVTIFMDSKQKE